MGILGYPNMDDDNRDGVFGDYSDIYSNFSEENSAIAKESDSVYGANFEGEINNPQQSVSKDETIVGDDITQRAVVQRDNSRLFVYVVALLLLSACAVGLLFYKN